MLLFIYLYLCFCIQFKHNIIETHYIHIPFVVEIDEWIVWYRGKGNGRRKLGPENNNTNTLYITLRQTIYRHTFSLEIIIISKAAWKSLMFSYKNVLQDRISIAAKMWMNYNVFSVLMVGSNLMPLFRSSLSFFCLICTLKVLLLCVGKLMGNGSIIYLKDIVSADAEDKVTLFEAWKDQLN